MPDARRGALLVAAILAVYAPRLNGPYLWDDRKFLIEQEFPRRPDAVEILFRSREYLQRWPEWPGYRPLNALTHIVDFRVWGDQRWGHRLTNVVIHSANTLLLWRLGLSFTGAPGAAWAAAGLFAMHPVVTETIYCAYLRTDALAALAVLSVLLLWRAKPGWAVAIYAAGLFMKETVGLAPLLLWLDPRPNTAGRPEGRPLHGPQHKRILPYVIVGGAYLLFRLGVVFRPIIGDTPRPWTVGFPDNLAVAAAAAVEDWRILLWPAHLSVDHPVRFLGWGDPEVWGGAAIWMALAAGAWWLMKRAGLNGSPATRAGPYERQNPERYPGVRTTYDGNVVRTYARVAGFGLAIAFLMRLPSAHILPRMETVVAAERYLYLPLAGVCLAVAAGLAAVQRRAGLNGSPATRAGPYAANEPGTAQTSAYEVRRQDPDRHPGVRTEFDGNVVRTFVLGGMMVLAGLGAIRSAMRGADWRSAEALFSEDFRTHPDSTRAATGLAVEYHLTERFDGAERLYREVLAREPWWPVVNGNLALILWRRQDWAGAEQRLLEALKWQPDDVRIQKNLAWTRARMRERRAGASPAPTTASPSSASPTR